MEGGCLICGASLEDKKAGAMTCGDTHYKQWYRMTDEEREAILATRRPKYPRRLDDKARLVRCETHGETFVEMLRLPQGWPVWEGVWMATTGCSQCGLESALQPQVKAIFKDRQDEYHQAVEARLQASSVQRTIDEETERLLAPKRVEIREDVENEHRSEIGSKVQAEMLGAIMAELKAKQPKKAQPGKTAEQIDAEREAYIADLMRPRSAWDTTNDPVMQATHAGRKSLGQE